MNLEQIVSILRSDLVLYTDKAILLRFLKRPALIVNRVW